MKLRNHQILSILEANFLYDIPHLGQAASSRLLEVHLVPGGEALQYQGGEGKKV